jgi:uncharacterized protein
MIIVSDTTTVANLFAIEHFRLLPALFGQIILPEGVYEELRAPNGFPRETDEQIQALTVQVRTAQNKEAVRSLMNSLDAGEAEAIILAEELHADTLIIDERKGRQIARERGLHTVGLLGIILQAKQQGMIRSVRPLLHELRATAGFYVSDALCKEILRESGEE